MANVFFRAGRKAILEGSINLTSDTLKFMLVDTTYAPAAGDSLVDDGTANDPASHEFSGSGYTGGFAGAGRKTLASKTFGLNTSDDKAYLDAPDLTWSTLNGADIGGAVLIKEVTDDAHSLVIAFFDPSNFTTNGGNVILEFGANGILRI